MGAAQPLEESVRARRRELDECAQRVLEAVEERARSGEPQRALEPVVRGLRDDDQVRKLEIAAEPRGAALEIAALPPAGELLEEVLDQVLLRELLDDLDLLQPDGDLPRDRARELDARAALRDEQADQLA